LSHPVTLITATSAPRRSTNGSASSDPARDGPARRRISPAVSCIARMTSRPSGRRSKSFHLSPHGVKLLDARAPCRGESITRDGTVQRCWAGIMRPAGKQPSRPSRGIGPGTPATSAAHTGEDFQSRSEGGKWAEHCDKSDEGAGGVAYVQQRLQFCRLEGCGVRR
jgi:hypothetical protein